MISLSENSFSGIPLGGKRTLSGSLDHHLYSLHNMIFSYPT